MNTFDYSQFIKTEAKNLGFFSCGISKAEFLEDEAPRLEKWLKEEKHGKMSYMENHFDKRLDPRLLVPDAKSVISLLLNYFTDTEQSNNAPKISNYAYGIDYHYVIKDKLKKLFQIINNKIGEINGRVFVDSAPVMEKSWAVEVDWVGKGKTPILFLKKLDLFSLLQN